ncbi:MAG: GlxA family transcriptional regulator [Gammaproteobacteria bacterium]|nr:GlxA family transcriptional regulator [Gammaproteobacteria bacterium]
MKPNPARRRPHHVVMLAYPDVQILDVTGPLEVFSRAARWMRDHGIRPDLAYRVEVVGPRSGAFHSSSGVRLVAERSYREVMRADTVLVAGGMGYAAARAQAPLLAWLRRMARRVSRLGSVCNGALILAASGLLDGHRATTHWAYLEELSKSIGSGVCHDAIYVRDGNVYTSAGVTAGMDMALAMLEEDHGAAVALAVARELVLFLKRPGGQSQFSEQLAAQFSEDAGLRELQLWMLAHVGEDLSVPRLAEKVAMSERSFARHFVDGVGVTPGHYVRQIRLTAARRKLEQTDLPLQKIAHGCGFGTAESLRRSFLGTLGVAPGAYRERFRGAVRPAG